MAEPTTERDLLDRAQRALRDVAKAFIVVHPHLAKPFPDAPDRTPWEFVSKRASAAYDLGHSINRWLRDGSEPKTQRGPVDALHAAVLAGHLEALGEDVRRAGRGTLMATVAIEDLAAVLDEIDRLRGGQPPAGLPAVLSSVDDVTAVCHDALIHVEQTCQYHGTDFGRTGWWRGVPRCDSCKQPWRVTRALAAIQAARGGESS